MLRIWNVLQVKQFDTMKVHSFFDSFRQNPLELSKVDFYR